MNGARVFAGRRRRGLLEGALATFVAATVLTTPASAHLGNLSYSEIDVRDAAVLYRLKFATHLIPEAGLTEERRATRAEVLALMDDVQAWLGQTVRVFAGGKPCELTVDNLVGPDANDDLQVIAVYGCPDTVESLRVEFHAFDRVLKDFENIASIRWRGKRLSTVFEPGAHLLIVGDPAPKAAPAPRADAPPGDGVRRTVLEPATTATPTVRTTFVRFLKLGFEHILEGYDHLLFLAALLVTGGTFARMAGIVTAFTLAHSLTLALAALGLFTLPPEPVELGIALSIVYVGIENLRGRGHGDRRWLVTFVFGLIHGFGFAGILAGAGLERGDIVVPLVGFNVGVELGQLLVVAVVVPLLGLVLRGEWRRPVERALSVVIVAVATLWAFERAVALAG